MKRRTFITGLLSTAVLLLGITPANRVVPIADVVIDGRVLTLFAPPNPNAVNAAGWWGLRGIAGACGFAGFCGRDAKIVRVYDQSGNGNDLFR